MPVAHYQMDRKPRMGKILISVRGFRPGLRLCLRRGTSHTQESSMKIKINRKGAEAVGTISFRAGAPNQPSQTPTARR
jgi:hypothetical protein